MNDLILKYQIQEVEEVTKRIPIYNVYFDMPMYDVYKYYETKRTLYVFNIESELNFRKVVARLTGINPVNKYPKFELVETTIENNICIAKLKKIEYEYVRKIN